MGWMGAEETKVGAGDLGEDAGPPGEGQGVLGLAGGGRGARVDVLDVLADRLAQRTHRPVLLFVWKADGGSECGE